MIEQLWDKYKACECPERWKDFEYMHRAEFKKACTDLLSSQWQTREPTREDGEYILVETVSKDGPPIREIIRREKFVKNRHVRFMSIPK